MQRGALTVREVCSQGGNWELQCLWKSLVCGRKDGEGDGLLEMSSLKKSSCDGTRSGGASWCSQVWKPCTEGKERVTVMGCNFQQHWREARSLGAEQQVLHKEEQPQRVIPKGKGREPLPDSIDLLGGFIHLADNLLMTNDT